MEKIVALFGEAEKGQLEKPYIIKQLPELIDCFGNPPPESEGLFFAIQALLYERKVIYFRVEEEGFSKSNYFSGLKALKNKEKIKEIHALCMPGVGDKEILDASQTVCDIYKSHLITTPKDLFDYLTQI
jgi:hypothetical protein